MSLPQQQPGFADFSLNDRVDLVCDAFEQAFRAGLAPRIEDYLEGLFDEDKAAAVPH